MLQYVFPKSIQDKTCTKDTFVVGAGQWLLPKGLWCLQPRCSCKSRSTLPVNIPTTKSQCLWLDSVFFDSLFDTLWTVKAADNSGVCKQHSWLSCWGTKILHQKDNPVGLSLVRSKEQSCLDCLGFFVPHNSPPKKSKRNQSVNKPRSFHLGELP